MFASCQQISGQLDQGKEALARDGVIRLLDQMQRGGVPRDPLVNHLVREVGLFPYIDESTSTWFDRFAVQAFRRDVGDDVPRTLHREQSTLLVALLEGRNIAVSAPTSFGKSFVIDAFIAARTPQVVVIIVPTIALADETRRRLQRKFGAEYQVVTAANQELRRPSILICPQERAHGYFEQLSQIDVLIVDEFYKASKQFDRERAASLVHVMQQLSKVASQRYYLAPNIDVLRHSPLTEGMEFLPLDFNTVFLEKTELYQGIGKDQEKKSAALLTILADNLGKTLIYAGSHTNVDRVATLLLDQPPQAASQVLREFASWLAKHYDPNWVLPKLIRRGIGFHTGQLHRAISQLQIRLFEQADGIHHLISTSSIIEGVNTSAENVILWSNRSGNIRINDFTYKNIIGRGGRMFRHFIGKIFVLEEPPQEQETSLYLDFPDEILGLSDPDEQEHQYTPDQIAKIEAYRQEMGSLVGSARLREFQQDGRLHTTNVDTILKMARAIASDPSGWASLRSLNGDDPTKWKHALYRITNLVPSGWEAKYSTFVAFVQAAASNWKLTIPQILAGLDDYDIGIPEFFKLERTMTFKLASLLGDINTLFDCIHPASGIDLTPAIARFSHAFLPAVVYQLEEYGLPRMLSKKLHKSGVIDFERMDLGLEEAIAKLRLFHPDELFDQLPAAEPFDQYILRHFYEGLGVDVDWES